MLEKKEYERYLNLFSIKVPQYICGQMIHIEKIKQHRSAYHFWVQLWNVDVNLFGMTNNTYISLQSKGIKTNTIQQIW